MKIIIKIIFLILLFSNIHSYNIENGDGNEPYSMDLYKDFENCIQGITNESINLYGKQEFTKDIYITCHPKYTECTLNLKNKIENGNYKLEDDDLIIYKLLNFLARVQIAAPNPFCEMFHKNLNDLHNQNELECFEEAEPRVQRCNLIFTGPYQDQRSIRDKQEKILINEDCEIVRRFVMCTMNRFQESCPSYDLTETKIKFYDNVTKAVECDEF